MNRSYTTKIKLYANWELNNIYLVWSDYESRNYLSANSGLTYADATITDIRLLKNGKLLSSVNTQPVQLTTRRDYKKLKEMGNPYISFIKQGDNSSIDLGMLSISQNDKIELEIDAELSNPDNQWGDRIMLYFFLDKNLL